MAKKAERYNYVIIGCGAAAVAAVEGIRSLDTAGSILIIGKEKQPAYSRPLTSYMISGAVKKEKISFRNKEFYKHNKVELLTGKTVDRVDDKAKELTLDDKSTLRFDKLLIASGGFPKQAGVLGQDLAGVFTLRTVDDAEAIAKRAEKARTALMIGGGFVSLKAAEALFKRGLKIAIVISSGRILSQMIDERGSDIISKRLARHGWKIYTHTDVSEIKETKKGSGVGSVVLSDGQEVPCELIVVGKGVDPSTAFLKGTKVKTHWGVCTDKHLSTNVKDIFAAGDVAETHDITLDDNAVNAVWPNAMEQGQIAGVNMAGGKVIYNGSFRLNSIEFFGLPVISVGVTRLPNKKYREKYLMDEAHEIYRKVVLKDNHVVGAILIGKIDKAGIYSGLIKERVDVRDFEDRLLDDDFNLASLPKEMRQRKLLTESFSK